MADSILLTTETPPGRNSVATFVGDLKRNEFLSTNYTRTFNPLVQSNAGAAGELARVCPNCVELFVRAKAQVDSHQFVFEQHNHVLPTPLRMNADERFTGRGVTIAFLDSGFY